MKLSKILLLVNVEFILLRSESVSIIPGVVLLLEFAIIASPISRSRKRKFLDLDSV